MTHQVPLQQSQLDDIADRLARIEATLGLSVVSHGEVPQVRAYTEFEDTFLPPFLDSCDKLGDNTRQLGKLLEKALTAQRAFLVMASQTKKPQNSVVTFESLSQVQSCINEAKSIRDNRSDFANHQNMIYEALQALGWLCVERTPKPFVDSFIEGLDFWGNKIRVQHKTSNRDHVSFVVTLTCLLTELAKYIKTYHLTGVSWNPTGGDVASYTPTAVAVGIKSIVQSSGKMAGLKKDTTEMETWHKDHTSEDGPTVDQKPVKVTRSAVCKKHNGNWHIKYQTDPAPLIVSGICMKQQVYIYGCENATILLKGKAKNIVLDSCEKTKLIFDNAVSGIEVFRCKSVQVQCKGVVPSVAIDMTDGCLVYISWEGRQVQFVTSKSSEMNVACPEGAGSDEYVERPIPEQFVHKFMDDLTISSEVSGLYSY
ncbi:Adenylyl cyclase-associated protein [Phytophthora cinnamomi]|uniref:Adenylyl cyclase-associated protein n=1 Tax=Phytophthora cinnamomi TaxID=4785 RepID=UPI00355A7794|nr:Adenylyl cyclase-associated protein [Phytophthora cinnamomi]